MSDILAIVVGAAFVIIGGFALALIGRWVAKETKPTSWRP